MTSPRTSPWAIRDLHGDFDFVITVCERARDAVHSIAGRHRLIHWRFDDPLLVTGAPREIRKAFQRARDELAGRVRLFAYAQTRHQGVRPRRALPAIRPAVTAV